MEKRSSKVSEFILYGGISKEEFGNVRSLIRKSNLRSWKIFSVFLEIIFLTILVVSILVEKFRPLIPYYAGLSIFSMISCVIILAFLKDDSEGLMPFLYFNEYVLITTLLFSSIYGTYAVRGAIGVSVLAIMVAIPVTILDKPLKNGISSFIFGIAYIVLGLVQNFQNNALKEVWVDDLITGIIFTIATIFISFLLPYLRLRYLAAYYLTQQERDTDSLTGVKNAIAYDHKIGDINKRIKNLDDFKFAVVVFDINSLKTVNDTYGHSHGDELIVRCSKLICSSFKHSPVYRIGGDEFVAILTDEDYLNKEKICRTLHERVDELHKSSNSPLEDASVAFGMSIYNRRNDFDYLSVFSRADADMYDNKKLIKSKILREAELNK